MLRVKFVRAPFASEVSLRLQLERSRSGTSPRRSGNGDKLAAEKNLSITREYYLRGCKFRRFGDRCYPDFITLAAALARRRNPHMDTLNALAARFGAPASSSEFDTHRLGPPPQDGSHAALILKYLSTMGAAPNSLAELVAALDGLRDEDELVWWRVPEGLAVTSASDGFWVLFTESSDAA